MGFTQRYLKLIKTLFGSATLYFCCMYLLCTAFFCNAPLRFIKYLLQFGFAQLSKKALLSNYFTNLAQCKLCKIIWILHFSPEQKISALLLLLALLIRHVFDLKFMDQTISFNFRFFHQKEKYIYIFFSSTKLPLVIWIPTYKHLHKLKLFQSYES